MVRKADLFGEPDGSLSSTPNSGGVLFVILVRRLFNTQISTGVAATDYSRAEKALHTWIQGYVIA